MEDRALIFDIKRDCSEDGPGIRSTVFFKGCPLSCVWCQNPEGKVMRPELSFRAELCDPSGCAAPCVKVCDAQCLRLNKTLRVDHSACTRCDRCVEVCPTRALEPVGYSVTVEELLYRVLIDKPFFRSTGGGVTLSGGEATAQMGFVHAFLKELKREGIHTALETCGFFEMESFRDKVLPYLDIIYFDIKLMDEKSSRMYTGRSNGLILNNFITLVREAKIPIVPRVPLVPGITATIENLSAVAGFLRRSGIDTCSLLPYNPLWHDKVSRLGITTEYGQRAFMSAENENELAAFFREAMAGGIAASKAALWKV